MKQVIDGKLYNTKTADLIGDVSRCGYSRSDFNWEDTKLYRTKSGAFFLAGEGNADSRWAESVPNGRTNGSGIVPITEEAARELAEKHFSVDEYIKVFGEPQEA
jgi:hypothetical protein